MAVELAAELAEKCVRLQTLFDAAMADLTANHPEGQCDYCRYKNEGEGRCYAADLDCTVCTAECHCKTCTNHSNWAWRVEV